MRRLLTFISFVFLPPLASLAQEVAETQGSHGGDEGWMARIWHVPAIYWQVVNILIVVALFVFLLRRPAPRFFHGRAKEILGLFEKAFKDKEDALARLKEVEDKMAMLGAEVTAIEQSAKEAAEKDRQRVQAEAETSRERIRTEGAQELERRVNEARRDLRIYAADLAVKMAQELASARITEEDEKNLQTRFLKMMEKDEHEPRG
jgi:F0F1-type ATP synthase membrane subunit b/b'